MNILGWINPVLGLLAVLAGIFVLRGVFRGALSSARTVQFLRLSLLAGLAGLLPLASPLMPVQQIGMVSVYCSAVAIVAWLRFRLEGHSRAIFAVAVTSVLYFDLVFVFTRLFKHPPLFTARFTQPLSSYQFLQILFAAGFVVLASLAARRCRLEPGRTLNTLGHS